MTGITFDAGGLIAVDRDNREVIALLARSIEPGLRVTIPTTALAQAIRQPAKQARLSRLIRDASTDMAPLDKRDATAVGLLLAHTQTSNIVDAHVVVCARRTGQTIVTSDPRDIRRLDRDIPLLDV